MKKLVVTIAAGVMGLALSTATMAQTAPATPAPAVSAAPASTPQGDEKVKIKTEELSSAVKTTLSGDAYKEWTVESAYHNKTKDIYEVEVKKGAETKTLKFSKDGKAIS